VFENVTFFILSFKEATLVDIGETSKFVM